MGILNKARHHWKHFLGKDLVDDELSRLAAENADRDFQHAVSVVRAKRQTFDSRRPPPAANDSEPPNSLDSLAASLETEARLMREAIENDDDPDE